MTGPKLNEGARTVGERTGTRASARYVRSSATKARQVLDLIRGLDARRADEVLQFSDRDVARTIRKVLASAVANAQHNDGQDPEELYVRACFADEGPTLRRFRPRARGRATRIRKRSCHITIIVDRMSDERLEQQRQQVERAGAAGRRRAGGAVASRRARVERSRQRAAERAAPATEAVEPTEPDTELDTERDAVVDAEIVETPDVDATEVEETEIETVVASETDDVADGDAVTEDDEEQH